MFYHAKEGNVPIVNGDMDYIVFGNGNKNLVIIPGLGDGLTTVKGTAIPFAFMYREYVKEYRVYVFSRKNQMQEGYTTREMAKDLAVAMKQLGILRADILGVSQGGMIAQYFAIDYPAMVQKLILAVTLAKQNETVQRVISSWMEMAKENDYKKLIIDTGEKTYSDVYWKKHKWICQIMTLVGKPNNFKRFLIMANACAMHDTYDELEKINSPTYVIGGGKDQVLGENASKELAEKIHGSQLFVYEKYGHGAYEEAKDFNKRVLFFLNTQN